ncbi:hypothetical protein [uncultured Alteromonas sp.]|jgi:hypothetical protein|uniref:hypothetical protein n=1 Tax=uncultured Alteromonas sp. TaxID=179113 RepID=UPI0025DD4CEE|nr:hypothetical protein [uncultured Alteromonas sp.]
MQNDILSAGDFRRSSKPKQLSRRDKEKLRNQLRTRRSIEHIREQLAIKAQFKEVWE